MSCNPLVRHRRLARLGPACLLAVSLMLGACASVHNGNATNIPVRPLRFDDPGPVPVLAYYQMLSKMSPAELGRERSVLAVLPPTPNTHLRLAMLLGHPRAPQDLGKGIALLDGILKANDPASVSLHPLARVLADNYLEHQREESQLERLGVQLKESQKRAAELQEKIDGLADIERTLPQRARPGRPLTIRGAK